MAEQLWQLSFSLIVNVAPSGGVHEGVQTPQSDPEIQV